MRAHQSLFLLVLIAAVSMEIGPAQADPIPYPEEFIGIWETTTVIRDCETQIIIGQPPAVRDTVCAGDTFETEFGDHPLSCTGTFTPTTTDVHCEGSYEEEPGCTASIQMNMTGTRNGDTWTTTSRIEVTYTGASCQVSAFCIDIASTGTRIDPNLECAGSPVGAVTWGWLKHRYE